MALISVAASVGVGAVKLLLTEVFQEVGKPWWENDKNVKVLHRLLLCIQPLINDMDAPGATAHQQKWLDEVQPCLEDIKKVLSDHEGAGYLRKVGTSKKLVQRVERLREVFEAKVPIMTLTNSNDVLQELEFIKKMLAEMKEQMAALEFKRDNNFGESQHVPKTAPSCWLQDTYTPFGGEHDLIVKNVIEKLVQSTSAEDLGCVGIWGLGGSGKTLTGQRVVNDNGVKTHFAGGCYWLTVGNSKTSLPNLLRELRQKMASQAPKCGDADVKNELFNDLKGCERVLLVLDDVWKTKTLEILDVMPRGAGCKVLITTRNEDVLDRKHATKFKMPMLPPNDSWELFCHHAWKGVPNMPTDLEAIGRQITRRCGGLPLALKVIGGHLAGKTDPSYWERTLEKLRNADAVSHDQNEQLYAKLEVSVNELDEVHPRLRDCFFYFAAFPEDFEVELVRDLFSLWLGDGIVGRTGKYDPMEEVEEMVDMLVQRSLIEKRKERPSALPSLNDRNVYVVHDVLRDLIHHMLQKVPLEKQECLFEAGRSLQCLPDGYHEVSNQSGGTLLCRRISIMDNEVEELPQKLLNAPKLEVMILRNNPLKTIPDQFLGDNVKNLRVLDLSRSHIRKLPKSLSKLKQLVVLNLSGSLVERISSKILQAVTKLQVLNIARCETLKYLPSSLSSLTKLQYLHTSHYSWSRVRRLGWPSASPTHLMKLVALKELRLRDGSCKVLPNGMFKALKFLQVLHLERFRNLVAVPEVTGNELQDLQEFSLEGCYLLASLPDSFESVLKNLQSLDLFGCKSLEFLPVKGLGSFGRLKYLDLRGSQVLSGMQDYFEKPSVFPVLKELHLGRHGCKQRARFPDLHPRTMPQLELLFLDAWEEVDFPKPVAILSKLRILFFRLCKLKSMERDGVGVQDLASLEELDLSGSKGLSTLPAGLEKLPKLRRISVGGTGIRSVSPEVLHLVTGLEQR